MGKGFDFIVIVSLLPSCCGFFVFGCGVSFFGRFQHPTVDGCSTASFDFGSVAEGDGAVLCHLEPEAPYFLVSLHVSYFVENIM